MLTQEKKQKTRKTKGDENMKQETERKQENKKKENKKKENKQTEPKKRWYDEDLPSLIEADLENEHILVSVESGH